MTGQVYENCARHNKKLSPSDHISAREPREFARTCCNLSCAAVSVLGLARARRGGMLRRWSVCMNVGSLLAMVAIICVGVTSPIFSLSQGEPGALLKVYYWPFYGRAGSIIQMLDYSRTPFEWVSVESNKAEFLAVLSARARTYATVTGTCKSCDTFAPPVVVDGTFAISQSTAAAMYIGDKVGLGGARIPSIYKAVQYLNDLADLTSEAIGAALNHGDDPSMLHNFLDGRLQAWMANIEHSISGSPYYFGTEVTYVDFYFLNTFDWAIDDVFYNALKAKMGNIYADFPKIATLLAAMRSMPSYASKHGGYYLGIEFERISAKLAKAY